MSEVPVFLVKGWVFGAKMDVGGLGNTFSLSPVFPVTKRPYNPFDPLRHTPHLILE